MKRTPLKPGKPLSRKTPMKRGQKPMAKVSKKNSKKWVDRKLIDEYMAANPRDELRSLLERCGFQIPTWNPPERKEFEPHHLFGNQGQRWDLKTNIVSVQPSTHDWCHDHKFQSDWRIIGLHLKWTKGEVLESEFKVATGRSVSGWLSLQTPANEMVAAMLNELKAAFP